MTTGEKIIRLRKGNNLTQEQFAELMDVSRQTVYKWESGESLPTKDNLQTIRDKFSLPLSSLYNDEYQTERAKLNTKSKKQDKEKNNKPSLFNILILILFVIIGVNMRTLSYEVDRLSSAVRQLMRQNNNLQLQIDAIDRNLPVQADKYTYYDYKILDYDHRTNMVKLQIMVTPTDYSRDTVAHFTVDTRQGSFIGEAVIKDNVYTAVLDIYRQKESPVYLYLEENGRVRSYLIDYLPDLSEDYKLKINFAALTGHDIMVVEKGSVDFRNSRVNITLEYTIDEENNKNSVYPRDIRVEIYCAEELLQTRYFTDRADVDFYTHIKKNGGYNPGGVTKGAYSTYFRFNEKPMGQGYTVLEDERILPESVISFKLVITDNHGNVYKQDIQPRY